jgi:hypothetical protein
MVRIALGPVVLWAIGASAQSLKPPRLIEEAAVEYPAEGAGASRDVEIVVTLDATGAVTSASAGDPADPFAAAALSAARRYRFSPATRDGTPVPSKIRLHIRVTPPSISSSGGHEPPAPPEASGLRPVSPATATQEPSAVPLPDDVRVRGTRTTPSPTLRTMDRREIETMPGTGGDALRTVEALPGVARAPLFSGLLIVRGSAPQDTQVFVDGSAVPLAFHFGGLSAIVPTELLERIDMYPGNYDVAFGRGMGAIVDVGLRSPARDGFHGVAKVDLLDARAVAEAPIDDKTRALVAARRSWVDAWFPSVAKYAELGVVASPVYYDYQAIIERDLGPKTTLHATFLGSHDSLAITLPPDSDPMFNAGNVSNATTFWRAQLRADGRIGDTSRWSTMASLGHDTFSIALGKLYGNDDVVRSAVRAEVDAKVASWLRVRSVDIEFGEFDFDLVFPAIPTPDEPDIGPLFGRAPLHEVSRKAFLDPAAYVALEATPTWRWKVIAGMRGDAFTGVPGVAAQPRLSTRYVLTSADAPKTTAKAAVGLVVQPPQPYENDAVFGTPHIGNNRALHVSAGIEQEIARRVELSLEPFTKSLTDLVSRRPDASAPSGYRYGNEGSGFVYGTELLVKFKPDARFWGWIAYTISRSERRGLPEEELRLFEYDQTHVLSALGSYRLGRGWEAGLRVRYVSGNPTTPVIGVARSSSRGGCA